MFHDGNLQSGIGRAIQENKYVACFVRQDGDEISRIWEEEWLAGQGPTSPANNVSLPALLADRAVTLRLDWGSQEAKFLNAFCPVATMPALVVIRNGQVLEHLESTIDYDTFVRKLLAAICTPSGIAVQPDGSALSQHTEQATGSPLELSDAESSDEAQPTSPSPNLDRHSTSSLSSTPTSGNAAIRANPSPGSSLTEMSISDLFPDRAVRLEQEKQKRETAEKAHKAARAEARRREEAETVHRENGHKGKQPSSSKDNEKDRVRKDWLVQQKIRKDQAKEDRLRILRQIESDKLERRAQAEQAREALQSAPQRSLRDSIDAASKRQHGAGGVCSLRIRLFDGSSIIGRFEPSATLSQNVREWIKREAGSQKSDEMVIDQPFVFKQILVPLPNRRIDEADEIRTLHDLGLTPSAILFLDPVDAPPAPSSSSKEFVSGIMRTLARFFHFLYSVFVAVLSMLTRTGDGGREPASSQRSISPQPDDDKRDVSGSASWSTGIDQTTSSKFRTLADQRAGTSQQQGTEFYNGNSSTFEGRKEDGDDDDSGEAKQ